MPDPNPLTFPPFAPFFPPSGRGDGSDGSFDFLPRSDRKPSGGASPPPPPPPVFSPSLDFSDARNSQYVPIIL